MTALDQFFSEVRQSVDRTLAELLPPPDTEPKQLYEAIRWSLFGSGKRFRPALVIASGRGFEIGNDKLGRTAAAVEMIHTYSLIHDDLPAMDDDDLRRGRATVHRQFNEATAILAGDALQAMAFETIAHDPQLSEPVRLRLISELSAAAGRMVAGQQLDLAAEGRQLDLAAVERIHAGKTGALIGFAVRAGGVIGETDETEMAGITRFGEKLGLLFQITDDILDLTATSETLGKTAGKDAAHKKATYPELMGLEAARSLAVQIAAKAVEALGPVARQNGLLEQICRYVLERTP
jgi:geranylgeranyl pyrophosphate synthase